MTLQELIDRLEATQAKRVETIRSTPAHHARLSLIEKVMRNDPA